MLAAGNTKISDLLCVTPPDPRRRTRDDTARRTTPADLGGAHIDIRDRYSVTCSQGRMLFELEGQEPTEITAGQAFWEPGGDVVHYQMSNLDADGWSSFLAVCICAPGVDMITMLEPEEIAARDSLRHPSARRHAD